MTALWPEIKRKSFHLGGVLYLVGLIYVPRLRYLALIGGLLCLEFLFELARLKSSRVQQWIQTRYGDFFREKERAAFSGAFWMLLGVLTTTALTPRVSLALTALLYLILGDGVASLIGMRFGGPHWPGSRKRLAGSFACFAVCVFVGAVMLRPGYGWHAVLIGAVVATAVELADVPIDDNFTIPVFSSLALLAATGVRPIF